MARVSLADVRAIPDPIQTWSFSLIIPALGEGIDVRCQTTSLPGVNTDSVLVALHGMETKYMGRETFSHQLSATFIETRDMLIRNQFMDWYKEGRNSPDNQFNFKSVYEKTANVIVYDDVGGIVKELKLYGVYPEDINEAALDGTNAAAMQVTIILSFDYYTE
jgi:hypothetical protein